MASWAPLFSAEKHHTAYKAATFSFPKPKMKDNNLHLSASVVFVLLLLLPASRAAIQCNTLLQNLSPCLMYLGSGVGTPSQACCTGVTDLASSVAASPPEDRRAACTCLVSAAGSLRVDETAAKNLASSCQINLPITLSANIDCSKVG